MTKDNFGKVPALVAGVSLLTDYVLTVSASVAAGTAALASAFGVLVPWVVPISVGFVILIAFGNLRGVKESGTRPTAGGKGFSAHERTTTWLPARRPA